MGYDPATFVTARHAGSATIAMRSTIGEAARLTMKETDKRGLRRRLWMPRSSWEGSPETAAGVAAGHSPSDASPLPGEAA